MAVQHRRGDVWALAAPGGRDRVAMIVSANQLNRSKADLMLVVPLTTKAYGLPSHVPIGGAESGLPETRYATVEEVRPVRAGELTRRLGRAPADAVHEVEGVLRLLLDLT